MRTRDSARYESKWLGPLPNPPPALLPPAYYVRTTAHPGWIVRPRDTLKGGRKGGGERREGAEMRRKCGRLGDQQTYQRTCLNALTTCTSAQTPPISRKYRGPLMAPTCTSAAQWELRYRVQQVASGAARETVVAMFRRRHAERDATTPPAMRSNTYAAAAAVARSTARWRLRGGRFRDYI